jgi:hypothetical protein
MISDGALPVVCLRRGRRKAVYRVREEILEKWVKDREMRQPAKIGIAVSGGQNAD